MGEKTIQHRARDMSTTLKESALPTGQSLEIAQGDLTQEAVDAIVNAANARLMHGGGVAAAISRRGGPAIQQESVEWVRLHGPVSHAEPAYTSGGDLPCRYVIHAVGPVWGADDEAAAQAADAKMAAAVAGSLKVADQLKLESIAFPAISTGIFDFPKQRAARVIFAAITNYLATHPASSLRLVRLTLYDQPTVDAFKEAWEASGK